MMSDIAKKMARKKAINSMAKEKPSIAIMIKSKSGLGAKQDMSGIEDAMMKKHMAGMGAEEEAMESPEGLEQLAVSPEEKMLIMKMRKKKKGSEDMASMEDEDEGMLA